MSIALLVIGLLLLGVTMVDTLWTILSTSGAGPMTRVTSRTIWNLGTWLHSKGYGRSLQPMLGPASLLSTMFTWVVLLWLAYLFVYSAYPDKIVASNTGMPADLWERIYFTGFTIFTLGVGDFTPASDFYRVVTAVASLSGLFIVTLSITYLLPVLSAVTEKRAFACQIHSLGESPQDILLTAWDGESFDSLTPYLQDLTAAISLHAQRHLSYPVLHHFQARTRRDSFPPQVATLSEAVMLLKYCIAPELRPDRVALHTVSSAIDEYMGVIRTMYQHPDRDTPPDLPDMSRLRAAGISICTDEEIKENLKDRDDHRRMLLALVHSQAWDWEEAINGRKASDKNQEEVG